MSIKSEIARKCWIKDLLSGRYVKREGWESNYFETSVGRISRVNIIAVVISVQDNTIIIDDGTGMIQLRSFEQNKVFEQKPGDLVLVIGKPRSFNEEKYVVPEIIRKIDDNKWIEHRKLELRNTKPQLEEKKTEVIKEEKPTTSQSDSLLKKIIELDTGNGVKISELLKFFDSNTINKTITQLIEEGEIFEIKPGIVKCI